MARRDRAETVVLLVAMCLAGSGCKHRWSDGPRTPPRVERKAHRAAKDSARIELDCLDLMPTTLSAGDAGDSRWYTVEVEGCDRAVTLRVTCAHGICTAEK